MWMQQSCSLVYKTKTISMFPVNLWLDLDKIATETLFIGNDCHTHPEQHIKTIEQYKYPKVVNLHKLKMAPKTRFSVHMIPYILQLWENSDQIKSI